MWWLRAHRAHVPAVTAAIVCVMSWLAAKGSAFDGVIPSPLRAGAAVPIVLWAPVALVGSVCAALSVDDGRLARTTRARSNGVVAAGFAASVIAVVAVGLAPALLAGSAEAVVVGRGAAGLVGLALVLRRRFDGATAAAVVAGYFVACALLGARSDGSAEWWAWPVAGPSFATMLVAICLFGAGLVATATRTPTAFRPGDLRCLGAGGVLSAPGGCVRGRRG
jgi:hypothetical protein